MDADVRELEQQLRRHLEGEVHFDAITRKIYSVDASIYEVEPIGVVCPKSAEELQRTLELAADYGIAVVARGAATGITGGCLGRGLIIDTSRHLTAIGAIDYAKKTATCECGVVQDRLNDVLAASGYRLGPDTSTGNRATLGGMLGNNAAGARSLRFGTMADHIVAADLFLAGGHKLRIEALDDDAWQKKCLQSDTEGAIYRTLDQLCESHRAAIKENFPKIPRRVSGYNLDKILPFPRNIAKLLAGAEGTLGIVSSLTVAIVKKPAATGLCLIHCSDMMEGLRAIEAMLAYKPLSLEMLDNEVLEAARRSPSVQSQLTWLCGAPAALFCVEFDADTLEEVRDKLKIFATAMAQNGIGYERVCLDSAEQVAQVWRVRKAGLGLLLSKRSFCRAIAFLEDISVGPSHVAAFMKQFIAYLKSKGKSAGIYGHVGAGCLHIRPYIDLRDPEELSLIKQMMLDVSDMLLEHGGALSGEHGDGLIRSWLNEKMFGKELYSAFVVTKEAFDPGYKMNPGKIVKGPPLEENLRIDPHTTFTPIETFLDFQPEGGYALAVEMCNGNGECRKSAGTMCPSFQATHNEYDSTRARAQALRSWIHGNLPQGAYSDHALHDILDLCLECKGCKSECPSQVDMAKLKAEFLHGYQKKYGIPLRSRLLGNIDKVNAFLAPIGSYCNWAAGGFVGKKVLSWLGIAAERNLPAFAAERFSAWAKKHTGAGEASKGGNKPKVVLLTDTFTEFNSPEIGQAAVAVLEALGYAVIMPAWRCCGRPLISKGLLEAARSRASALIAELLPYAAEGLPIVGLEPSCILSVKDDYAALVSKEMVRDAQQVAGQCMTFAEFLAQHTAAFGIFNANAEEAVARQVLVHGHCHQKSVVGMAATMAVLGAIKGVSASLIPAGCCGMAGGFGYESEHYEISMQIGELHLFPAVREAAAVAAETIIIADGTSCRCQILQGTGVQACHLAEFLAAHLYSPKK